MSGADLQQLQQMAQQAQMPPMQRQQQPPMMPQMPMQMQPMQQMPQMQPQFDLSQAIMAMQRQPVQQVQNPIFGGAIPMNFGLPQASQIPADFQVRQFTPGKFNPKPKPDYSSVADRAMNGEQPYYSGFDNQGE